jgi:serine/threonine-protein kinase
LVVAGFFLARNLGYLGGSASFNLPDVSGQPVAQATTTLKNDGLVVKVSDQSSTQPAGTVLSTDPAAKALVKKGDTVTLKVAVPPTIPNVTVPSGLTGVSQATAESLLTAQGLQYTTTSRNSTTVQTGFVISTTPTSGTRVKQGSSVELIVSSGQANVLVPSLIGLTQDAARTLLAQYGLTEGGLTSESSSQYAAGQIITSVPGPGASVPPSSSVSIVVSTGPPPVTTTTPTTSTTTSTTSTTTPTNTSTTQTTSPSGHKHNRSVPG